MAMSDAADAFAPHVNDARYRGQPGGFYESYFQRANHPTRPLAFWIRYTLFSPRQRPEAALGELWAVYCDGETGRHLAVKHAVPLRECAFNPSAFAVAVGAAQLGPGHLSGAVSNGTHAMSWDLAFAADEPPLLLLPPRLYTTGFPAAKSLVGAPLAVYNGDLSVNGAAVRVTDWVGSQNHNWGTRHTDRYAWGQVAGFDTHPASFLEVATARLRLGPLWTPPLTLLVLRHNGKAYALNTMLQSLRAASALAYFTWRFHSETSEVAITGTISARREALVGLRYANPPGGIKHCLNTKIAACELRVRDKRSGEENRLATQHRAAFEILTDDRDHGVPIVV
jgi:hypothetical protein